MIATYFFKLFDNLSCETEVEFAELEIQELFSKPKRVKNIVHLLVSSPFSYFAQNDEILSLMTWHLAPGSVHGFTCQGEVRDISALVARLAYVREIYVALPGNGSGHDVLNILYPQGRLGNDVSLFETKGGHGTWLLFRIISRTFFLENMKNVVFLSVAKTRQRQIERLNENVDRLVNYAHSGYKLYPLFPDSPAFKEIEDFFETRTEIKLYLTHAWGAPYKGKFHPRMAKALINATCKNGVVLDPFVGSGTTTIEAVLMGLDSIGTEINPFCAKTANAKVASLYTTPETLEKCVENVVGSVQDKVSAALENKASTVQPILDLTRSSQNKQIEIYRIEKIRDAILEYPSGDCQTIMYAALGKVISEVVRARRRIDPLILFDEVCLDMIKTLHAFGALTRRIKLNLGRGRIQACDAKHLPLDDGSVDSIVTSPSYSTAIDYVKNDENQLLILENADLAKLNSVLIGSPRPPSAEKRAFSMWQKESYQELDEIPQQAKEIIKSMLAAGRIDLAARQYKYLVDMKEVLAEMWRVLRPGAKAAIVIGNNHFRVDNREVEFKNDDYLNELADIFGLKMERRLHRRLTKTMLGAIQIESILILRKQQ